MQKKRLKKSFIKSGIMLGLGEEDHEIEQCLLDLLDAGVDIVTMGQYMRPSRKKLAVKDYVPPEKFEYWKRRGEELGVKHVYSGPYVRSSYNAGDVFDKLQKESM